MAHRYLMNDSEEFVAEAAEGLTLTEPSIVLEREPLYLRRRDLNPQKVGIVSGGGTGHEPLHAGFVGVGMLDAAVPGAVFASPTAGQVAAATRAVDSGRGVLQIVKNYTGDVLNFSIAAEFCEDDGVTVRRVLVDDDVATDIEGSRVGRRGTAATLVVEKLCGAAAEKGLPLDDLVTLGERVVGSTRSMALALDACTHPGTGMKSFELADDEVEFGVGIHGERGRSRVPNEGADALVERLVSPLVEALSLTDSDQVIAIVNGLGATHLTEQYVVTRAVHRALAERGIRIARTLTGSYVTALDMSGVSITLSKADEQMLDLWDAPVKTPGLTW